MLEQSPDPDTLAFQELYRSILFLLALFLAGDVFCQRVLRIIPSLVGQIFVGVVFGPYVLGWLPSYFSTLGQVGLVLMICQAGLEMDFATLKAIGPRGAVMAVVGSILPSGIGIMLSYTTLGLSPASAIAAGCSFGPTSAGIAMNVLEQCGVLGSQVGQLVVAIAIVDDILALVVLSQLRALTGVVTISSIIIPIISAFLWLFVGGAIAIFIMPHVLERLEKMESGILSKYHLKHGEQTQHDDKGSNLLENQPNGTQVNHLGDDNGPLRYSHLWHILILLLVLLPGTFYTEASYLLGAFLAGLAACRCHPQVATEYQEQFNVPIKWLMRIFFGATIGFEIPVTLFFEDPGTVIGPGFLLALSLLGKVATGPLLTPILEDSASSNDGNSNNHPPRRSFDRQHLRDVAIVGFSMAGEAEFAFLVAGFGLNEGMLDEKTYASVVFAILLSTIISPILLRSALSFFGSPSSSPAEDDCILRKKNEYTSEDHDSSNIGQNEETVDHPQVAIETEHPVRFETLLKSSSMDQV